MTENKTGDGEGKTADGFVAEDCLPPSPNLFDTGDGAKPEPSNITPKRGNPSDAPVASSPTKRRKLIDIEADIKDAHDLAMKFVDEFGEVLPGSMDALDELEIELDLKHEAYIHHMQMLEEEIGILKVKAQRYLDLTAGLMARVKEKESRIEWRKQRLSESMRKNGRKTTRFDSFTLTLPVPSYSVVIDEEAVKAGIARKYRTEESKPKVTWDKKAILSDLKKFAEESKESISAVVKGEMWKGVTIKRTQNVRIRNFKDKEITDDS